MRVAVDRTKAGELGVSAGQVGYQLRQALFGEKAGIYKKDGEDYDINVRFQAEDRYSNSALDGSYTSPPSSIPRSMGVDHTTLQAVGVLDRCTRYFLYGLR